MSVVHNQRQMNGSSRAGPARGECSAHTPAADYAQDWPLMRAGLNSSKVTFGAGFGRRPFPFLAGGGDCNRPLAKITSARSHFQCVSERHQRHFNSRLSSPVRDARTKQRKASHCAGQKPQGYGNV